MRLAPTFPSPEVSQTSPACHRRTKVLYLSYDGVLEPLGQAQILPYLYGLCAKHHIHLLTFEKPGDLSDSSSIEAMQKEHAKRGLRWMRLRYHKRPNLLATAQDVVSGIWAGMRVVRRENIEIVHARGYVPALVALPMKYLCGCKFVFDMRGFWADQRVDSGYWHERQLVYRLAKWFEARFFESADLIITITNAAADLVRSRQDIHRNGTRVEVIPTSVDLEQFRPLAGKRDVDAPFVLGCLGNVRISYLLDDMLDCFKILLDLEPNARLLMVNREDHAYITRRVQALGIPSDRVEIIPAPHTEVASYISRMDAAVFILKRFESFKGVAPTKLGELLACGVPCLSNAGIGDFETIFREDGVGVAIEGLSRHEKETGVKNLLDLARDEHTRRRCVESARKHFSLEKAIQLYDDIYASLSGSSRKKKILVICPHPENVVPGQRLKYEQYFQYFRENGYDISVSSFMTRSFQAIVYKPGRFVSKAGWTFYGYLRRIRDLLRLRNFDVVYIFLWVTPFGTTLFERIFRFVAKKIIYDIDDLVFLGKTSQSNKIVAILKGRSKPPYLIRTADHVITCTPYLDSYARQWNQATTDISSTINTETYTPVNRYKNEQILTLGWSGSHSTSEYLHIIDDVLRRLAKALDFRLLVIGDPGFKLRGINVDARGWNLDTEVKDLQEIDIGLYPLPDELWVQGKSGLKALQYMALGIPTVASAVGANFRVIEDGLSGLLVNSLDEWEDRILRLAGDPELRRRIGTKARERVEQIFSIKVNRDRYLNVLKFVSAD
jgi:glycosyltransferase involved in cell wall biosynthesis